MGAPRDHGRRDATYAETVRQELRVRCVHLLTKEAFVGEPSPHETEFEADGAIWWCDRTCGALGPDGRTADADACHGEVERRCYEPPLRPPTT